MTDQVQKLWERILLGGLGWVVGVTIVIAALFGLGGAWGIFWACVGLVVLAVGGTYALIGIIAVGVKLGREAAELDA